jgi:DNA polymerase-2
VRFQQDRGFTRQSRAEIPGRVVLDGIPLVRDALRLEDYRLDTVARAILGRGKRIDREAPDAAAEISRMYRDDPKALVEYNREDARLVLQILEHEGLIDLAIERSLLSGMPLDRVGASIASFDLLYLPELRRRGVVAPSVHSDRKTQLVAGGALLEPQPGIFRNVAVFDFKSLYPSLIRTFNLDPLAHARADGDAITAPNGARFARHDAILPKVIERFMHSRDEARRRGDRHADQAIKIMMNALFGVLGAASCRFFDAEVANAITGFGQQMLRWTRDLFEQEGVRVLYGDTDSIFAKLSTDDAGPGAEAEASRLRERAQEKLARRIRAEYEVEPQLELELERIFDRFLLPQVRGGPRGSKKRYAGWSQGKLEIVGLESVRRDWPAIARRLQEGMLERLFSDRAVVPFVRELVERLRRGELDRELVYAKRVRKGSLDRYTATTPPHIQAARKLEGAVPPVVRYVITRAGPEPRPLRDHARRTRARAFGARPSGQDQPRVLRRARSAPDRGSHPLAHRPRLRRSGRQAAPARPFLIRAVCCGPLRERACRLVQRREATQTEGIRCVTALDSARSSAGRWRSRSAARAPRARSSMHPSDRFATRSSRGATP